MITPPLCSVLLALGAAGRPLPPSGELPRLVVLVVVDQLVPEQLERLAPVLDGGLGRFWREGSVFRAAALDYANTETGPGHATFATGCRPATHGIVGNVYHDRGLGRTVYCLGDPDASPVTSDGVGQGGGVSPRNLRVPTLADHLREAFPGSRAFAISCKDRAAVALGGRAPSLAVWWDRAGSGFSSSTFYGEALPEFLRRWNASWHEGVLGYRWEPVFQQDPGPWGTGPDERPGEAPRGGGVTFPHVPSAGEGLDGDALRRRLGPQIYAYPLGDAFVADVAQRAVQALELGADEIPDLLGMSFSGCDVVGHGFGPYSWEVTDMVLRLDDALGELFARLDEGLGAGRWIAALSSDHGVLELPEALAARGVGARRVGPDELGAMARAVREAVESEYGVDVRARFVGRGFALDEEALRAAGHDPAQVRATVAGAAVEAPFVAAAYTLEELAGEGDGDGWIGLYRNCFVADRSPDVVLRPEPWVLVNVGRGTSHGSPYAYDRRVPLAFLGAGVAARQRFERVRPEDAVPTLMMALGLEVPQVVEGRPLELGR